MNDERLDADTLAPFITSDVLGRRIEAYDRATSTQQIAFESAERSETNPDGTLVIAEYQTQGRGRLDRRWVAPPYANLLFSLILCPRQRIARPSLLTTTAGIAVIEAIQGETGLRAMLKWPNDVMLHDRKLCGILTEAGERPDGKPFWIVGVGVNVNVEEGDFPMELVETATSLLIEGRAEVSRPALLGRILARFEEWYGALQRSESEGLLGMARRRSATLGYPILLNVGGAEVEGVAFDLDDDGALLVRSPSGRVYRVLDADDTTVLADRHRHHHH